MLTKSKAFSMSKQNMKNGQVSQRHTALLSDGFKYISGWTDTNLPKVLKEK